MIIKASIEIEIDPQKYHDEYGENPTYKRIREHVKSEAQGSVNEWARRVCLAP